jgi:tetratricopeptide (TPR) repeat protein
VARRREPPPPVTIPHKRSPFRWDLLIIVAVAFAIRVVVALQIGAMPLSRTPQYDSLEYLGWARHLVTQDFTWPVTPPHGPAYPFFLAALLVLTGSSLTAVRVIQALVGALTCLFVARATTRWFGERAGLGAGLILALYAPLIWIDVSIFCEGLLLALLAAALWCLSTERHPLVLGLLLGVSALTRPTALFFLPLFVIAGAKTWRMRAALIAIVCAVIAPVTIANARASHAFLPIQAFGGMNVYLGNSPFRDGLPSARPGGDWDRITPEAARQGALGPLEEDRYFNRKVRSEVAAHPVAWVKLVLAKSVRTLQNDEIRDTHSFYFFAAATPLLRFLPGFTLLLALAAMGVLAARRQKRTELIVLAYIGLGVASCALLVVAARYRLPIVIGLAVFGGVALEHIVALARTRAWRELAMLIFVGLIAGAFTRLWPHPPSHNVSEELALSAGSLAKEGNAEEAERYGRQAVEADGTNPLAWNALGMALKGRGDLGGAGAAFARALSLNDGYQRAHVNAGSIAEAENDDARAEREYARAAAIDPQDPLAVQDLAGIEIRRGDLQRARSAYERLVLLQPRNVDALLKLARIEGASQHPAEGLAHVQQALALEDAGGDDWLLAATLAAQAKRFDVAEEAMTHAQALLGATDEVLFTAAVLRYQEGRFDDAAQYLDQVHTSNDQVLGLRAAVDAAKRR